MIRRMIGCTLSVCGVGVLIALGVAASARAPEPSAGSSDEARGASGAEAAGPVLRSGGGAPATGPSTRATETYPPEKLVDACRRRAASLTGELDETFSIATFPPFVVAGNMHAQRLRRIAGGSVLRPAEAMWIAYFDERPDHVITILLFDGEKPYRAWARKLFDDRDVAYFGYYKPDRRTLVMNIATGGGTLVHELTHALIEYDFPDVPTWFNEGLASLHEQCRVEKRRIVGLTNWRLAGLQKAIRADDLRPLRDLVTKDDFYGRLRGVNYAQARYFVMYMQKKGVLDDFYGRFREDHEKDDAAVRIVADLFDRDFETVEREFVAWVKTLRFP